MNDCGVYVKLKFSLLSEWNHLLPPIRSIIVVFLWVYIKFIKKQMDKTEP